MTNYTRVVCKFTLSLNALACALIVIVALCGKALADDGPQIATATTQDLLEPVPGLSVVWHGKQRQRSHFGSGYSTKHHR